MTTTARDSKDPSSTSVFAKSRISLAGKLTAYFFFTLIVGAAAGSAVLWLPLEVPPWTPLLVTILVGLPLGAWLLNKGLQPINTTIQSLSDGIRSFRDRDFSLRIASHRTDELGELARLYNQVSQTLQDESAAVRERELLLQTALNRSPAAILLVNHADRILYSNVESRRLLMGGDKVEGRSFSDIRAGCPPAMREILDSQSDGVFTVQNDDQPETYHLAQRHFQLNRKRHVLVLLRRLTGELGRQEAEIWKKVIRVISHELNNSLAPISSLVHSAKIISQEGRQTERVEEIYSIIEERIDHLKSFLGGYASFARLPEPRPEAVDWSSFLATLSEYPDVQIEGRLPKRPGWFDPAQMRHVLVNLLKNAEEASESRADTRIRINRDSGGGVYLLVLDHGSGMSDETMKKALLPFYSTKRTGTGLGLPLCREILEAHGGKLSLESRPEGGTVVTCWLPPR